MIKELKSLAALGSFVIVEIPRGANILKSVEYFRKKRYPDGTLKSKRLGFAFVVVIKFIVWMYLIHIHL